MITDKQIKDCTNPIALFTAADQARTNGDRELQKKLEARMDELEKEK